MKTNTVTAYCAALSVAALSVSALSVGGCATSPDKISATYVSPLQYQAYECDALRGELIRIGQRVDAVTGQQRKEASNDAVAMGVGLVLFWPALFFLAGGNDKKEELARLKGEHDALRQAAAIKGCGFEGEGTQAGATQAGATQNGATG